MSYIPRLRRPIDSSSPAPSPTPRTDRVRFSSGTLSTDEKRRRKADAFDYLRQRDRQETREYSAPYRSYTRPRPILRHSYHAPKTYERLGETPIPHLSDTSRLSSDDSVLQSVRREASRRSPLRHVRRQTRRQEPVHTERPGLLHSLSSAGAKLLSSVLFSEKEEKRVPRPQSAPKPQESTRMSRWNDEELKRMRRSRDLEREIEEKQAELERLDKEVRMRPQVPPVPQVDLEQRFASLEDAIRGIGKNNNSEGLDKVASELSSIKDELFGLKKRQETASMKFESKVEELKLEAEISRKSYRKMVEELEQKRQEVEKEKDSLIEVLRKEVRQKRKREEVESESEDVDVDLDDSDNDTDSSFEPADVRPTKRRKIQSQTVQSPASERIRKQLNRMSKKMKILDKGIGSNREQVRGL